MQNTPELLSYIKISLSQGESREQIETALKGGGWLSDEISQAFDQVSAGAVTKLSVPVPVKPHDRKGRLITVVATLGSILIGVGLILFIASNWQGMGRTLKVGLVFGILLAIYSASYYLQFKKDYSRVGRALAFLGTLAFGGAIVLIAQIFNIVAENNNTLLWWALLILPIVFGLKLGTSLLLSSGLMLFWSLFKTFGSFGLFFGSGYEPIPHYWYPVLFASLILPLSYRILSDKVHAVNLGFFGFWLAASALAWHPHSDGKGMAAFALLSMVYGLMLYTQFGLHRNHPKYHKLAEAYAGISAIALLSGSFLLSWRYAFEGLASSGTYATGFFIFFSIFATLAGVSIFLYAREQQNKLSRIEIGAMIGILAALVMVLFMPPTEANTMVYLAIFNVAVFALSIGFIYLGYSSRAPSFINIGIIFFSILVITKYFEWTFELFDKSFFFMVGGLLLVGLSIFMERQRRRLLKEITESPAHEIIA